MTNDIVRVRQLTSEIDGWLSDSEGELLYELAKGVPSGQAIVELGSWKGKSTVWLAKGTEAGHHDIQNNHIRGLLFQHHLQPFVGMRGLFSGKQIAT